MDQVNTPLRKVALFPLFLFLLMTAHSNSYAQEYDPWSRIGHVLEACKGELDGQRQAAHSKLLEHNPYVSESSTGILWGCGMNYNAWSSVVFYLHGCWTVNIEKTIGCESSYCEIDVEVCGGFHALLFHCDDYNVNRPGNQIRECTEVYYTMNHPDERSCPEGQYYDVTGNCVEMEQYSNNDELCTAGNPIDINLGNKIEHVVDYTLTGPTPFEFSRTYNSINNGWTFSTNRSLTTVISDSDEAKLLSYRPDGSVDTLRLQGNNLVSRTGLIKNYYFGSPEVEFEVSGTGLVEYYNHEGKLNHIKYPNGNILLTTESGYSSNASINPAHLVTFRRDTKGRITEIRDGFNITQVTYQFDAIDNLKKVIYANGDSIEYLYEDPAFPHALTGYKNNDGQRVAQWEYDNNGRAVSSSHYSDGELIDRYDINVISQGDDERLAEVKNQNGQVTLYHYEKVNDAFRIKKIEGLATDNCLPSNTEYNYYPNGNVRTKTSNNGNTTEYEYNERHLITKITEASGTENEREVNQEWHPDEYKLLGRDNGVVKESYIYNVEGRLIGVTKSPTEILN